jgi:pimeloyl-ACP methyl ester carboxylesterase
MALSSVQFKSVELPNGETIAYQERAGGKKKVLLIHGNMTSSKHWDLVLEHMDPDYKLYAIDLRGFGRSTYHQEIRSIEDFSEDVKDFTEEIQLDDFSIMGWSLGGAVGMQFAAEYPGRCTKLVLLASASTRGYPFYGTSWFWQLIFDHRLRTYHEIKMDLGKTIPIQFAIDTKCKPFLKIMWSTLVYTKNQPDKKRYDEYIDDTCTQRNLAAVYHALNIFNISDKYNGLVKGSGLAKNISIPVLVLRGERDYIMSEQMAEEIVADIGSNAKFIELKDCGHSPLIDDLDQLLQVITNFLG